MIAAILSFLSSRLAAPLALLAALALGCGFAWQSARIEGVPLLGGGLKAQIARLNGEIVAEHAAAAASVNAAWAARQKAQATADAVAATAVADAAAAQSQIRTVLQKVPVYVSDDASRRCVVPWGAVRLLDAAASGADPDAAAAHIAPGQPDDAASDVTLSEAVALLAADLGIARQNAGQLRGLEAAVKAGAP
jgi:hypothetical protein